MAPSSFLSVGFFFIDFVGAGDVGGEGIDNMFGTAIAFLEFTVAHAMRSASLGDLPRFRSLSSTCLARRFSFGEW